MGEWKECKLGSTGKVITGKTPSKENPEDWGNKTLFITPSDYGNYNKCAWDSIRKLSQIGTERQSARLLPSKSILVTCIGSDMGKTVINYSPCVTNQQINAIIPYHEIVDTDFLYYETVFLYDVLHSMGSDGTAVPILNKTDFENIDILLPPLPEQKAIAAVLSSLDDKIDLLHRQNKTLEAMAETLFRQWFVEEADEGWEEGKISDLCIVITKGTTPTTLGHQFTETGINFVKAESITDTGDFIWNKFAKISDETHIFLNRSILQEGDILCSIAGTIGRVAITTNDILPANTNQAIAILRVDNKKCFPEFIYLFMKSALFREIMDGKIVHAVQPNLSLGEIGNSTLKIPPFSYLMNFKNVVQPIFAKKKENYNQIRTLEKLRDTLLPKLMSGEVRVKI